jgi:hypothetical protein
LEADRLEVLMKKQSKGAAMFDLFDQPGASGQVGERQVDLEDLIAWEDSLAAAVMAGDKAKADAWVERAQAGEVMRIM